MSGGILDLRLGKLPSLASDRPIVDANAVNLETWPTIILCRGYVAAEEDMFLRRRCTNAQRRAGPPGNYSWTCTQKPRGMEHRLLDGASRFRYSPDSVPSRSRGLPEPTTPYRT